MNFIIFLNILGAMVLGLLVGYERSYRGRAAGMRTYGLVCAASCALTVIGGYPEFWFAGHTNLSTVDPGRVIQGVVSGIGFLGAGVIMRDGMNISGLTTAASIWSVAAIGVLVGVGFYGSAILLAILSGGFMMWGTKIEMFLPTRQAMYLHITFKKDYTPSENAVRQMIVERGYEPAEGSFNIATTESKQEWRFVIVSLGRHQSASLIDMNNAFAKADGVESFHIARARN